MTERVWASLVIGGIGIGLTIARRAGNKDTNAGYGVAGWTVAALVLMWVFK